MGKLLIVPLALALVPTAVSAEVVAASENGFEVQHSINLVATQTTAFAAFGRVANWWDKAHTYSGDPGRMSLQLRSGGCFCETTENGGGVEHMHVTYVQPPDRVVMTGSLGPMLYQATAGVMDVKFERTAGGTRVTMNYRVAGFAKGGAAAMAPAVDQVLGAQMKRYRTFAASEAAKR